MARKKKVVISDQELTPTVLATIEEKKFNLLSLILLFAIFGGVVFYLPEISTYVEQYLNPSPSTSVKPSVKDTNDNDEQVEIEKYPYTLTLSITKGKMTLSNFSITNDYLSLQIANSDNVALDMDEYNYYLEMYSEDDTLLQRIKMDDFKVGASSSIMMSYSIKASEIAYFTFLEISEEEYPSFIPIADANKEAVFICQKDTETINYKLKDNKLYAIEDIFMIQNTEENFTTLLGTYQSLAATYNAMNGVVSEVTNDGNILRFITNMDLTVNNSLTISKIIYPKDTDAKVIKFELSSKGYTCD